MEIHNVVMSGTKATVLDLVRSENKNVRFIGLQALVSNGATIFFGDDSQQIGPLAPGEAVLLPETSLKRISILGTATDIVIISVFR